MDGRTDAWRREVECEREYLTCDMWEDVFLWCLGGWCWLMVDGWRLLLLLLLLISDVVDVVPVALMLLAVVSVDVDIVVTLTRSGCCCCLWCSFVDNFHMHIRVPDSKYENVGVHAEKALDLYFLLLSCFIWCLHVATVLHPFTILSFWVYFLMRYNAQWTPFYWKEENWFCIELCITIWLWVTARGLCIGHMGESATQRSKITPQPER